MLSYAENSVQLQYQGQYISSPGQLALQQHPA